MNMESLKKTRDTISNTKDPHFLVRLYKSLLGLLNELSTITGLDLTGEEQSEIITVQIELESLQKKLDETAATEAKIKNLNDKIVKMKGLVHAAGLRVRRHGLLARVDPQGIRRSRFGRFVEPDYQIVDIYSSRDTYLNSALTDTAMSGRTILSHLGMTKRLSARVDQLYMGVDEQLYWREFLPTVIANDGYGWIYLPEAREPTADEDEETGKAMGRRYDVQTTDAFLLVGEQRAGQSYWHVFTVGQDYVTTALKYGAARLEGDKALLLLGLVDQING